MEKVMTGFMLVLIVTAMSIRIRNNYKMRQFEKTQEKLRKDRKEKFLKETEENNRKLPELEAPTNN